MRGKGDGRASGKVGIGLHLDLERMVIKGRKDNQIYIQEYVARFGKCLFDIHIFQTWPNIMTYSKKCVPSLI